MKVSIQTLQDAGIIELCDAEYGYYISYCICDGYVLKIDGHEVNYIQDITEQGQPEVTVFQITDDKDNPINLPQYEPKTDMLNLKRYEFEAEVYTRMEVSNR